MLQWYSYIDFLRYAWGALMRNQFLAMGNPIFMGGCSLAGYTCSLAIHLIGYMGVHCGSMMPTCDGIAVCCAAVCSSHHTMQALVQLYTPTSRYML